MPSLPIPLVSSLILAFLLVRMWMGGRRHQALVALLAICAVQGVIISLAQHYRVPGFALLQPITATLIPPASYLAFQTTAVRTRRRRDLLHFAGPLAALAAITTFPPALDLLIPVLFVGYGLAVLWTALQGADAMPRMRLSAGDLPGRIWLVIGAALVASAFSDVAIIAAQIAGAGYLQPWIISIYSSTMLLVVGGLSLSRALDSDPQDATPMSAPEVTVSDEDTRVVARLDALMREQQLYLNPDLTLSQLARKLIIPTKQLSGAINRVTGENVSRYINAERIRAAQAEMRQGQSITNAMLAAGFNTKSNFNREFLRVAGQTPSDWLAAQG